MNYHAIHNSHRSFDLIVTFVLLGTALITMMMMFIHPTAAIFLFWLGLLIAAAAMVIELHMRRRERAEVRRAAAAHCCPNCGFDIGRGPGQSPIWRCDQCGTEFSPEGDVLVDGAD